MDLTQLLLQNLLVVAVELSTPAVRSDEVPDGPGGEVDASVVVGQFLADCPDFALVDVETLFEDGVMVGGELFL